MCLFLVSGRTLGTLFFFSDATWCRPRQPLQLGDSSSPWAGSPIFCRGNWDLEINTKAPDRRHGAMRIYHARASEEAALASPWRSLLYNEL